MGNIFCIVEGHGEVGAVPILIRRVCDALNITKYPNILHPMRVPATKLVKEGELERAVELGARKLGEGGAILILIDCDDGCPAIMGPDLLRRARAVRPDRKISVVLAKREYEAWFLASAESLRGKRGIAADIVAPPSPEAIRDAKGWLSGFMGYSETTDQPALTAQFDLQAARSADSFDKFYREVSAILTPSVKEIR